MWIYPNSGDEVIRVLQRALNYNMVPSPNLIPDGKFGPKTLEAVQRWQRSTGGFVSSGYGVDENTQASLGMFPGGRFPLPVSAGGGGGGGSPAPGGSPNPAPVAPTRRIYFEWKANARLQVLALSSWGTVQAGLGAAARAAGFDVQYNSYEMNFPNWTLVMRGLSPANATNADEINNLLISMAEQAGFTISRDTARVSLGSTVTTGGAPGSDPNGKPNNSMLGYAAVGLVALLVVRQFFSD